MPRSRRPSPAGQRRGRPRTPSRSRTVDETSAGGLVVDAVRTGASAVLIGRTDRRGRLEWILPKGHLEAGETAEDAAVREVAEETGLDARIVAPLGSVDYWFVADSRRIHKVVHHFLLEATGGQFDDTDAEVTELAWVPVEQVADRLRYASERRLLARVPELLADPA